MKIKEDIINDLDGESDGWETRFPRSSVMLAMDEYAKQQAIAFAAYIGKINVGEIAMPGEKTEYDWEELYPHFIEYQSQNK